METFAPDTTYRHMKIRIATERPFEFVDVTPDVEALITQVARLNADPAVDGILVQLPLPSHIA